MTDFISKQKTQLWLIIILVIFNGIALFLLLRPKPMFPPPGAQVGADEMLSHRLDLSESQRQKMDELREAHFKNTDALSRELKDLKRGILEEAFSKNPDRMKAQKMARQIGGLSSELELNLFDHFNEMNNILDIRQKEEFVKMLDESMKSAGQRGNRPPIGKMPPPPGRPE